MKRFLSYLRPLDLLILAAILLLACLLAVLPLHSATDDAVLTVKLEERELQYSLRTDTAFSIASNGHTLTVVIRSGKVYVKDADCPRKLCVGMSPISRTGEVILCSEAKILLSITGGGEGGLDGVTG